MMCLLWLGPKRPSFRSNGNTKVPPNLSPEPLKWDANERQSSR